MATYTLIESKILTSTTATVTFTGIPQTYTDLLLKFSLRSSGNSAPDPYNNNRVQINSDTGNNYSALLLFGNNTTISSASYGTGSNSGGLFSYANGNNTTANVFSNGELYIPNYTDSNQKSYSVDCVVENNATWGFVDLAVEKWHNTNAITAITLTTVSGAYQIASTFYLYGIKSS